MAHLVFLDEEQYVVLNKGAMPKKYNLFIFKGDYVEIFATVTDNADNPIPLGDSTPTASLRLTASDPSPVEFVCTPTSETGEVRIFLPSELSATLVTGEYLWSFKVESADGTKTYLAGRATVLDEDTLNDDD